MAERSGSAESALMREVNARTPAIQIGQGRPQATLPPDENVFFLCRLLNSLLQNRIM